MNLEDLQKEWANDSDINTNQIGTASLEISMLHGKYYKLYIGEAMKYKKMEHALKVLKLEKYEFLTLGHTDETKQKGWQLPPQGKILKNEVQMYIDADKDIIDATLKLSLQKEKVDFIESILRMIQNRNFQLKVALDFEKFKNGL